MSNVNGGPSEAARRWAERLRARAGAPEFLGPRRPPPPGKEPQFCGVCGMQFVNFKAHRETGVHKRAVRAERAARHD